MFIEGRERLLFGKIIVEINQNDLGTKPPPWLCVGSPKTYRLLVPHQISRALGDLGNKVENEDEDHDEWTNHSPCRLPEDIGLVADHELNICVEPAET